MLLEQKNKTDWQPSASIVTLRKRAEIIKKIREFFAARNVLEVETPLLAQSTVTDPYVHGIHVALPIVMPAEAGIQTDLYLQTSPEYAMKRLLAAGSGCIYQICKAFRLGDIGQIHAQEFTMLEWYRIGFDHHALMDEMALLLQCILGCDAPKRISYANLFVDYLEINPHLISDDALKNWVNKKINLANETFGRVTCLELLFKHFIEPYLPELVFIYDFPACQAALARVRDESPPVASRFEVYYKGVELANGFHELANPVEQRKRFENDVRYRIENSIPAASIDEKFLAALEHGLPDCAGVALGIDRLIMLALGYKTISEVKSF